MKKPRILSMLIATLLISFTVISQISYSKKTETKRKVNQEVTNKNFQKTSVITDQENLTGTWYWESSNAINTVELHLTQNGNTATGKHCSSFSNGTKLDCASEGDENSITLNLVSNNVFEGTLKSAFSDAIINIRVTLNPITESIQFQQLSQPSEEYYLPDNVTMTLAQD